MIALLLSSALAAPLAPKDVPLDGGAFPTAPTSQQALEAGTAICTATLTTGEAGKVTGAVVAGCAEPFLSHTRQALAGLDVQDAFASEHPSFVVLVPYEGAGLVRKKDAKHALTDAVLTEPAPEKYYDKKPFLPRGQKGGMCTVQMWIDPAGEPYAIDMTSCRPDLHLAVEMAAMEWRYTPVQVDGEAVPARFSTSVNIR